MDINRPANPTPPTDDADEEEVTYLDLIRYSYAIMMEEMENNPRVNKSSMYFRHFKSASLTTFIAASKYIYGLVKKAESLGHPPAKATEKALSGLGIGSLLPEDYSRVYFHLTELNKIISDCERNVW